MARNRISLALCVFSFFVAAACERREPSASRPASNLRFRAVYLDMDGTALGPDHKVRPRTIEALEHYRRLGGRVGLITGRIPEQVVTYLPQLRPNLPLVLFNGAAITDAKGQFPRLLGSLDGEALRIVLSSFSSDYRALGLRGLIAHTARRNIVFPTRAPGVEEVLSRSHIDVEQSNRLNDPEDVRARLTDPKDPAVKIMLITASDETEKINDMVVAKLANRATALISDRDIVEVLPRGINKATTLRRVLDENGLACSDVVVFGDSGNDREMVGTMPVSIAMGNCRPATCESALFVAAKNDTDAIAEIIERLVIASPCRPTDP